MLAAALALVAQACDGLTFALAVSRVGIGGESNPAMAALYGGGIESVLVVKAAGALACALIAWRLSPRPISYLPFVVGAFGTATNLWSL